MMLYKVKAKINKERMGVFWDALNDGRIESVEPDGPFIIKAMKDALMTDDDTVEWYEACYCDTPLKHERESVYDKYMYNFHTELKFEISNDIVGESFWEYLAKKSYDETYSY